MEMSMLDQSHSTLLVSYSLITELPKVLKCKQYIPYYYVLEFIC